MGSFKNVMRNISSLLDGIADCASEGFNEISGELNRGFNKAKRLDPKYPDLFLHSRGSVAVHEAGHALVCWRSPTVLKIMSARLHDEGGTVIHRDTDIPTNVSRWYGIAICLAGIAAEIELYGRFQGKSCRGDLLKALKHAKEMAAQDYQPNSQPWRDDKDVKTIDVGAVYTNRPSKTVNEILCTASRRARANILEYHDKFMILSMAILRRGELNHDEIIEMLGPRPFNEMMLF